MLRLDLARILQDREAKSCLAEEGRSRCYVRIEETMSNARCHTLKSAVGPCYGRGNDIVRALRHSRCRARWSKRLLALRARFERVPSLT